jgi:hypothetical protein
MWSSFAEKELKEKHGQKHVKTVPGSFDFSELNTIDNKSELRGKFGIDTDSKIFGFVFRNQLRKLVGSLLEGFKLFKENNPDSNAKLLLHTNWSEGWNIPEFIKEFNLRQEDILTSYICSSCHQIDIRSFVGQKTSCRFCKSENGCSNPTPQFGCSESQLNEIYNVMDAYIHPMTSGGLEMPVVEAMACSLPVATVPYSCGEDYTDNNFVYPLEYSEYREIGSNFKKASVNPESIKSFMEDFIKNENLYKEKAIKAKEWALEKYSIERIGKLVEKFIDSCEKVEYSEDSLKNDWMNENYKFTPDNNNTEFLLSLYSNILNIKDKNIVNHKEFRDTLSDLEINNNQEEIYNKFISLAKKINLMKDKKDLSSFIDDNGKKKILLVMPDSIGDCYITLNIIKSINDSYDMDTYDLYISTKEKNNLVFKPFEGELFKTIIPYSEQFDQPTLLEGVGNNKGYFDIVFSPYLITQRMHNYTHNGQDINFLQE